MKVLVALLILVLLSIGVGCSNEDLESTTEPISIKNKKADVSILKKIAQQLEDAGH